MTNIDTPRPIHKIAEEIDTVWRDAKGNSRMYFGAVPYVAAMRTLTKITDTYGADNAASIVMYFLSNATTWRGEDARRIKAELKEILASR